MLNRGFKSIKCIKSFKGLFTFVSFDSFVPFDTSGFTLIELVVSIGILAILAVFALVALNPIDQFRKSRDAQRKSDLAQVQRALEQYYQDHGVYPNGSSNTYTILDFNGNTVAWGGSTGWVPYMNVVPADPDSARQYLYVPLQNHQAYALYASLEKGPNDPQTCNATVPNCINNPNSVQYCTCTGAVGLTLDCGASGKHYPCNFGVSSPNVSP